MTSHSSYINCGEIAKAVEIACGKLNPRELALFRTFLWVFWKQALHSPLTFEWNQPSTTFTQVARTAETLLQLRLYYFRYSEIRAKCQNSEHIQRNHSSVKKEPRFKIGADHLRPSGKQQIKSGRQPHRFFIDQMTTRLRFRISPFL